MDFWTLDVGHSNLFDDSGSSQTLAGLLGRFPAPAAMVTPAPKKCKGGGSPPPSAKAAIGASDTAAVGASGPAAVGAGGNAAVSAGGIAAVGAKLPKSWAALSSEKNEKAEPCEVYIAVLVPSVRTRLEAFMRKPAADGGIDLSGTLASQSPLQITKEAGAPQLKSFKEHWRWENCVTSLEQNSLYEAPGNVFWVSLELPVWGGRPLAAAEMTYGQLAAGRQVWSDEKFQRSSDDPNKRHYIITHALPTAVVSLTAVPSGDGQGFVDLPCLGSRSTLAGFYSTMDDALRANDGTKIKKLFEAALSMPLRLRVGPSYTQVSLDSITYSEDLYAAKTASSDSFFDFTEKVMGLFPAEPAVGGMTSKAVIEHMDKLGVTFHGKRLGEPLARAVQQLAPYAQRADVRKALKALEDVSSALNDQTKISMLCNTASKHFGGKGSEAAFGAIIELFKVLRVALLYKDIKRDTHVTKEFLVGKAKKVAPFFVWSREDCVAEQVLSIVVFIHARDY